jgi:hypothetical protein
MECLKEKLHRSDLEENFFEHELCLSAPDINIQELSDAAKNFNFAMTSTQFLNS